MPPFAFPSVIEWFTIGIAERDDREPSSDAESPPLKRAGA
jgi:hypothetical protein